MGLFDTFNLVNSQRSGGGYPLPQGGASSIPQFNPAVAKAPAPVMPSYLGSGQSNFAGTPAFNPSSFPSLIIPSYESPQQQALSRQAGLPGGRLNFTC